MRTSSLPERTGHHELDPCLPCVMTPTTSPAAHLDTSSCANCGASLAFVPAPQHCPQCGQRVQPLAARAFVRDAFDRYARSVVALVFYPGKLTQEFLAGRREHFVPPLRLYLAASFVFFLLMKVISSAGGSHLVLALGVEGGGTPVTETSNPVAYRAAIAEMQACLDKPGSCSWAKTLESRIGLKGASQSSQPDAITRQMFGLAPNAVFVLLPAFAALLMLAYRSRRIRYGSHFVFSLHMHSFGFLALLVLWKLPNKDAIDLVGLLLLALYWLCSLHRVYGGRWWATLARTAMLLVLYLPILLATIVGLSIASIFLA